MKKSDFEDDRASGQKMSCRLCGSTALSNIRKLPALSWMLCKNCLYLHRHALLPDYDEIFVRAVRYQYDVESEEEFLTGVNEAGQTWRAFARWVDLPPDMKVLDFGSGYGVTLEYLKSIGVEAQGVEPGETTASYSAAKGHSVLNGYLSQESFTESYFDVIHIQEPMDYVPNPSEVFRIFHRILKEDGLIFWTERQYHWSAYNVGAHMQDNVHAAIFSSASIKNFCALTSAH